MREPIPEVQQPEDGTVGGANQASEGSSMPRWLVLLLFLWILFVTVYFYIGFLAVRLERVFAAGGGLIKLLLVVL